MLQELLEWCKCVFLCTRETPALQHDRLDQVDESYKEMQTYGGEFTIVPD
jgi:hypothetical protein